MSEQQRQERLVWQIKALVVAQAIIAIGGFGLAIFAVVHAVLYGELP